MQFTFNLSNSRVIESREGADGQSIRRRRETPDGKRFTTYERIERPILAIIKRNGNRELFDRNKLLNAVKVSVGKFFSSEMEIENIVNNVVEKIYDIGELVISSHQIGDLVLEELHKINDIAYVRFASVYYDFKTLEEFRKILLKAES